MFLHNPFGPIFEKELRATSRRKRTYVLRSVYLGGLLLFLVMAYVSGSAFHGGPGSVAQRVAQQNRLGREFFVCFSLFCTGSMAMIGPVLTCTAISAERLHKTLHVLLMTPITTWQIVTGKLFSRLLVALTLIGLSLPVLALVRLLGGVELGQMFGVIALATATAVAGASVGLFISTFVNRAYAAILFGYGVLLVLWVFVPIFIVVVSSGGGGPPPFQAIRLVCTISPLFGTAFLASPMGPLMSAPWGWCVAVQMGLSAGLVATSAGMLRRLQRREGRVEAPGATQNQVTDMPAEAGTPRPANEVQPLETSQPRKKRGSRREVGDNPVLWRELGRPLFARRWQSIVGGILIVALLLVSYVCFWSADALGEEELQFAYAFGFNAVAWLVIGVLAATAIAQEKESDTWTLLLATPICGRDIVLGKIGGIYRRLIWPTLLVAAHFAVFAIAGVVSWTSMLLVLWVILSFNTVWVASGVYLSLRLSKVTFAVIVNLSIALVLYVGVPILLAIATELVGSELWAEQFLWGFPYFYVIEAVEEFQPGFNWLDTFYRPGGGHVTRLGFVEMALMSGLAHIGVAFLVVSWMVNRFNRIVNRAGQTEPLPPVDPSATAMLAAG